MTDPVVPLPAGSAQIVQLSASAGGVPKLPVATAHIGTQGLVGDQQRDVDHHGGVERALCLYSLEVIEGLQREGHPVGPGTLGENITIAGLDWATVHAGMRLRLGSDVVVELTRDATPCRTIMRQFADWKFSRISHRKHPGWSRFYARVEHAGDLRVGDAVMVLP